MVFGHKHVTFPVLDNLRRDEKARILPTVADADMDKHCILPVLAAAWNATGMTDETKDFLEFPFSVQITCESFTGLRKVGTTVDLTYSYIQQQWKRERGDKWPHREYKIFDIKRTEFKLLS